MRFGSWRLVTGLFLLLACGSETPGAPNNPEIPPVDMPPKPEGLTGLSVVFGDDVDPLVQTRVKGYLTPLAGGALNVLAKDALPSAANEGALVLSFGDTALSRQAIPESEQIAAEGYVVRSQGLGKGTLIAGRGRARAHQAFGNLGSHHAVYAILESLGFGFLHPLKAIAPAKLASVATTIDVKEAPRWDERMIHLHTMHPLELTDFLQGWGPGGPEDRAGFLAQMPEWDSFLEWCVANGQNSIEWFILWAQSWEQFADSDERMDRLRLLVERAHAFGIAAGVDVPLVLKQQHSYRLLRTTGELPDELAEIRMRIAHLMQAKFDSIGTETGTSEFTHPPAERMLAWMNELAKEAADKYKIPSYIKVHTSTGQVAEGYPDPKTGQPINFNFLPHFADPRLGILAHTVQHYGLTDPAPTYGNETFEGIRDFLHQETPGRPALFYPETAYWVSFDIDVPLFLPLYAERRTADLRMLALDEDQKRAGSTGKHMGGQVVFSSGWEWGYWLNDVAAARASWNPHAEAPSDAEAFRAVIKPALRMFGAQAEPLEKWILRYVDAEYRYLIQGEVAGKRPAKIEKRNGQAYLQGWETWDDVSETSANLPVKLPPTQPSKLGLVDMRNPLHGGPSYSNEVKPLLSEMETAFGDLLREIEGIRGATSGPSKELIDELADAAKMTFLRARQVHGLYDYADDALIPSKRPFRLMRLAEARTALDQAAALVKVRERSYRVPADRIAGWRNNPTAYSYGYLWSVRSLHYFWRDEGKAVDTPAFPCYMNIVNPVDVANGEGFGTDAARFFGGVLAGEQSRGCLAEPKSEPVYPQDNIRTRP
jgi:hypothetical protein